MTTFHRQVTHVMASSSRMAAIRAGLAEASNIGLIDAYCALHGHLGYHGTRDPQSQAEAFLRIANEAIGSGYCGNGATYPDRRRVARRVLARIVRAALSQSRLYYARFGDRHAALYQAHGHDIATALLACHD